MDDDLIARLRSDEAARINWDDHINGRLEHRKPTARELEAADALEAQARRIAELEKDQRDSADVLLIAHMDGYHQAAKASRARIAELTAALRPFADIADESTANLADDYMYPDCFSMRDLRAARAAYYGEKE